jgi:hypothetical protein
VERDISSARDNVRRGFRWNGDIVGGVFLLGIVALFVAFGVESGMPSMRHDWALPATTQAFRAQAADALSTWHADGIGWPNVYPTSWIFFLAQWLFSWIIEPRLIIGILLFIVAGFAVAACRRLTAKHGGVLPAALAVFALFNPWCYTQLVAGHLGMMLAYAATLLLIAELRVGRTRSPVIVLCIIAISAQIQYLVGTVGLGVLVGLLTGDFCIALLASTFCIPAAIGIVAERGYLDAIPYLLTWQKSQSLAPTDAPLLLGYFASYTKPVRHAFALGVEAFAVIAFLGAVHDRNRRSTWFIALGSMSALIYSLGIYGPWPQAYAWIVVNVHPSGLFRELYDLLGYVAVGYLVFAALAALVSPALRWLSVAGAFCLIGAWIMHPPSTYWVDGERLPAAPVSLRTDARFALIPAFQPLRYLNEGSGTDPDLYPHPVNRAPLNQYFPTYPAETALAKFINDHQTQDLSALGVGTIISRPFFSSDVPALAEQLVLTPAVPLAGRAEVREIPAAPLLSLLPAPQIASLDTTLGFGNVFMLDAMQAGIGPDLVHNFRILHDRESSIHPESAWVDVRLTFIADPEYGQALGGVFTRSTVPYEVRIDGDERLLTFVRGRLMDETGRTLATTTPGYVWIMVPNSTSSVHCDGACVIVALASFDRELPLNGPAHIASPVPIRTIFPWLATAEVTQPSVCRPLLRYNVRYDPAWTVWSSGTTLTHVRVDATVNGWMLPCEIGSRTLIIIQVVSALQQCAEVLVTFMIGFALWNMWRRPYLH